MPENSIDLSMDSTSLYREETFTDRHVGSIKRLTPVTKDGSDDTSRNVLYVGQTQLMTPVGALPLNFEIAASSLGEAAKNFAAEAAKAAEGAISELKELQRQAASSIDVPAAAGGAGLGGIPGGGKIQMP